MYASGSTDSNDGSSTPSTASNTLPSESTLSNNIGNTADLVTEILAVHNNERKARWSSGAHVERRAAGSPVPRPGPSISVRQARSTTHPPRQV